MKTTLIHNFTETHWYYNVKNFPHLIAHHGNWDIYANDKDYCAAIPTDDALANGCKATHFGSIAYAKKCPDVKFIQKATA